MAVTENVPKARAESKPSSRTKESPQPSTKANPPKMMATPLEAVLGSGNPGKRAQQKRR
jgi:hypothetical protein